MKYPWFKKYGGDWLKDPNLSMCGPAARGIWEDAICRMYELRQGSLCGTLEQLSRLLRASVTEVNCALDDLHNTGTAHVVRDGNGLVTLTCRRLEREFKKSEGTKLRVRKLRGNADVTQPVTPLSRGRSQKSESEVTKGAEQAPKRLNLNGEVFAYLREHLRLDGKTLGKLGVLFTSHDRTWSAHTLGAVLFANSAPRADLATFAKAVKRPPEEFIDKAKQIIQAIERKHDGDASRQAS